MRCPGCGNTVPFSKRALVKKSVQLEALLKQAGDFEDLTNDMGGSRATSLRMERDMALRGQIPQESWTPSEEEVAEAVLAERSDTWKRGYEILQQMHEVIHGREGTVPSDNELLTLQLKLLTGPGGSRF